MFCSSCGNSVAGVQFCAKCGTPVAGATAAPAAPVTPTPAATPAQPIGSMAYPAAPKTNGMAIASLVTSLVCCGIPIGLVLGIVAKNQIKASAGKEGGDGLATAGIILGALGLVGLIAWLILIVIGAGSSSYYYGY